MFDEVVVVRGGGDLGSGTALRLWRAGFRVIVLEIDRPIAVRRSVALSEAIYNGRWEVEEVTAVRVASSNDAMLAVDAGHIPVLIDPRATALTRTRPHAVIDAVMAKRNLGTHIDMAKLVVGLGPGFWAGRDCHAVVETNRGPALGRVTWQGPAQDDTGEPGEVGGRRLSRVLRAPAGGIIHTIREIGEIVAEGAAVAHVGDLPITSPFQGMIRGLIRDGVHVTTGMKVGDIDPRLDAELARRVSDKSLAVAGGVLEAVLQRLHGRLAHT